MFISNFRALVLGLKFLLVNILENIFKAAVVFFKNRIFSRKIKRPLLLQSHIKATTSKSHNRFIGVVHRKRHAIALKVINFMSLRLAAIWSVGDGQFSFALSYKIGGFILI